MHQEEQEQLSFDMCKVLKLTNGETIIGVVSKETASYVEVSMPYKLSTVNMNSGRSHLVAQEWDTSINFDIPVRVFKTAIVAVAEPNEVIMKSFANLADNTPIEDSPEKTKEEFYEAVLNNFNTDKIQ
jgi:hypothetical protein